MPKYPRSYPEVKQVIQGASVIQVKDPEQTARYYRDKLGFEYDFGSETLLRCLEGQRGRSLYEKRPARLWCRNFPLGKRCG